MSADERMDIGFTTIETFNYPQLVGGPCAGRPSPSDSALPVVYMGQKKADDAVYIRNSVGMVFGDRRFKLAVWHHDAMPGVEAGEIAMRQVPLHGLVALTH